ncbi:OmpA family protein [Alkalimarinus coralli]|uniref:OmpA family protein n=1 Tax=Alkalimarinus coralli TaxID=2935863 RepID=UPI00202B0311|nr:OmpA family protein [Alkalimarinus coralli]
MNKNTRHQTAIPTKFVLKPLLMALPLSVLAACASQQNSVDGEATPSNAPDVTAVETSSPLDHTAHDDNAYSHNNVGPDLTDTEGKTASIETAEPVEATSTAETETVLSQANPTPTHESPSDDTQLDAPPEGDKPMTVLVIENPDILSKLASENLKPVVPTTPKIPAESMHRPGKRVFHFGFNQTALSEEDKELIEKHAKYLKANPELEVTIHGHTDAQGNPDYNLALSKRRAAMMHSELIKQGVDKDRIKTIGWGGGYPLVSTLNFAENRRIELEYSEIHYAANR